MDITRVRNVTDLDMMVCSIATTKRMMLGIAGAPGSGKSTVAAALVALDPVARVHVPMDGFHLADQSLVGLGMLDRKGAPETFDSHGYAALLSRLRTPSESIVYAPAFERDLEQPLAGALPVAPSARVIITEGNYLLFDGSGWSEARRHLDEIWYIDVDPEVRRRRLVERHIRFGKTPIEAEQWVRRVDEPNAALVDATKSSADRILDCSTWQHN